MEELTLIAPGERDHPAIMSKRHGNRARTLFEPLLAHQRILRGIIDRQFGQWLGERLLDLRDPNVVRDKALIRHQQLPSRETLHSWDDELSLALDGKVDEKILVLASRHHARWFPKRNGSEYSNLCRGNVARHRRPSAFPEILAAAILRIWRKDRFPPTIAELLDECDHALQGAANARRVVAKMIGLLDNAEEVLIATGDISEGTTSMRS